MPRITDKLIRGMPTPKIGQKIERDTLVIGFGVRKTASGHTAFIFNYTFHGRDRRMTIGQYSITPHLFQTSPPCEAMPRLGTARVVLLGCTSHKSLRMR